MSDGVTFPNESDEYRNARNALLQAEAELRANVEKVAALRRTLPMGGKVREDYAFTELVNGAKKSVKLSELFSAGKDTLFVYNYMYGPNREKPCPLCTSFLDGLNGQAVHLGQRIDLAVVTKSPIARSMEIAHARGWKNLRLVSSHDNAYNRDYFGEDAEGNQWPMANVFARRPDGIHHFWGSELLYLKSAGDSRHIDLLWPLWNVLDLTPEGRGATWYPKLAYE